MKVYRVTIQTDGEISKRPGEVSTEIVHTEMYCVAKSIKSVFDIALARTSIKGEVIAVVEVIPNVIILD